MMIVEGGQLLTRILSEYYRTVSTQEPMALRMVDIVLRNLFLYCCAAISSTTSNRLFKRDTVFNHKDRVALVGDEVSMECRTSLKHPMTWHFSALDGTFHDDIYYGEMFVYQMEKRYRMDTNRTGEFTLVIPSVDTRHAGAYRCDDDEGLVKDKFQVELTVLESRPFCTMNGAQPDRVICSVNATGSLQLYVVYQNRSNYLPTKRNNTYSFSKEFQINDARNCKVCFMRGPETETSRCVFEIEFHGIPPTTDDAGRIGGNDTHLSWHFTNTPYRYNQTNNNAMSEVFELEDSLVGRLMSEKEVTTNNRPHTVAIIVPVIIVGIAAFLIGGFLFRLKTKASCHANSHPLNPLDKVGIEKRLDDIKQQLLHLGHPEIKH